MSIRKHKRRIGRRKRYQWRVDGSPYTKPSLGARRRKRRAANKIAKASRKVNR
jgi:hypothetical protein